MRRIFFRRGWTKDLLGELMRLEQKEEGILKLKEIVREKYTPYQMVKKLGANFTKICDGYCHIDICKWIIQEAKSQDIDDAIKQLESSYEELRKVNRQVHLAFIILKKLAKSQKRKYVIKKFRLYMTNGTNALKIKDIPLYVIYKKDLNHKTVKMLAKGEI